MGKTKKLRDRLRVRVSDTWDLSSLYVSDEAWEADFQKLEKRIKGYEKYRGKLTSDAAGLAACLKFDLGVDRLSERLGVYAFLKTAEDQTNGVYQRMYGRFQNVATRAAEASSFIRPELLSLPQPKIKKLLAASELQPYRRALEQIVRYKPHTLGLKEEQLLAMQGEMAQAVGRAFRQLLDADMKFGFIENEAGDRIELTNATFSQFLHSPQRAIRKKSFAQYYEQFSSHENTLAATLAGSVQTDVYYARARGYRSSLHASLFADNVPESVYNSLIAAVRKHLPAQHRYFDLRRRNMRLKSIHHYDTYVPILSDLETKHNWNQAVRTVVAALQPLGDQYCSVLEEGLTNARWSDRYPNKGKQSGAFSCGSYDGAPYILMNYKPELLDDMFTLAHEAGHSMHSHYSAKHQPYQYYDYTIFVAEVASTFNEQLLSAHLTEHAKSDRERAYLINRDIDSIRATIIRQTMFAEFEKTTHEMAESGEPLTVDSFKTVYRELLATYFGPDFAIDEQLALECLRIPHFYRAFYVYKYATGLSAAIALSQRVRQGGDQELDDYLRFLQGGCSKDPLDLLRDAGVDMESPEPVETALTHFEQLVSQLDELL
jgi:oligoendopeptidase F